MAAVNGTGAVSLAAAILAGIGFTPAYVGNGGIAPPEASFSGAGFIKIPGVGAIALGPASFAGVGFTPAYVGVGGIAAAKATFSAGGAIQIGGTGGVSVPAASFGGYGTLWSNPDGNIVVAAPGPNTMFDSYVQFGILTDAGVTMTVERQYRSLRRFGALRDYDKQLIATEVTVTFSMRQWSRFALVKFFGAGAYWDDVAVAADHGAHGFDRLSSQSGGHQNIYFGWTDPGDNPETNGLWQIGFDNGHFNTDWSIVLGKNSNAELPCKYTVLVSPYASEGDWYVYGDDLAVMPWDD